MKLPNKIFLVGLPGSGKSTFGNSLAQEINRRFIDLDDEIVGNQNRSIPEIFKVEGEDHFRIIERENLHKVVKKNDEFLLATGGGTACFFDNMEFMKTNGFVIFLNSNIEDIVNRVLAKKDSRPLIEKVKNENMISNLKELHKKRLPHYMKAHMVLDHHDINLEVALEKLLKIKS
ncbi:MAG: shikimate kinase [Cyclobacteriaceae bacterium]|nr:shikimate kinase [Cyclobacteriaceae bacterium]